MLKKFLSYAIPMLLIFSACFLGVAYYLPHSLPLDMMPQVAKHKKLRIGIATNSSKFRAFINNSAIQVLEELSEEYDFEFIHIESGENLEWVYYVGEIHEENPLDLLIGVGWEASEVFPIIYSRYEDLCYIVLDNKVEFPYVKSIYFSRYDCSYIIGAMMATAFPKEEIFGFISHFDTSYTNVYLEGYTDGLHSVNPKILVQADYTKNYDHEQLVYDLAKEQNEQGIKFTMSILSPKANQGLYAYAKHTLNTENPLYTTCIGIDETSKEAPFIVTGITENIELALRLTINDFIYHGYSLDTMRLTIAENGADVLFGSTLDAEFRNEEIITEDVLAAGNKALLELKKKNSRAHTDEENQLLLHTTYFKAK